MPKQLPLLCEICGKRRAVAVVVVQHLAVNVCKVCKENVTNG